MKHSPQTPPPFAQPHKSRREGHTKATFGHFRKNGQTAMKNMRPFPRSPVPLAGRTWMRKHKSPERRHRAVVVACNYSRTVAFCESLR